MGATSKALQGVILNTPLLGVLLNTPLLGELLNTPLLGNRPLMHTQHDCGRWTLETNTQTAMTLCNGLMTLPNPGNDLYYAPNNAWQWLHNGGWDGDGVAKSKDEIVSRP